MAKLTSRSATLRAIARARLRDFQLRVDLPPAPAPAQQSLDELCGVHIGPDPEPQTFCEADRVINPPADASWVRPIAPENQIGCDMTK